jgi:hypothetical protein
MAIRPDIDPKSASPRSGAQKAELEQYGVWVKAEPQDVIEESSAPLSGDLSFDLSDGSSPVAEESFLSAAEEKLLNTFDEEFEASQTGPLPDIEDMPELDESLLGPEGATSGTAQESALSMDIEDMTLEPPAQSSGIEDLSSEFLEAEEPTEPKASAEETSGFDDVTSEFVDMKDSSSAGSEFDNLDMDLNLDDSSPATEPESSAVPLDAGFDDVSAVERELASPAEVESALPVEPHREEPSSREAAGPSASDLSNELLKKIAEELSSIRGELVSLKSQIGDVVASVEATPKKAPEAPAEVEPEPASGGFFDEEEDETIALTGDELDNILNTADFTEEVAESEQPVDIVEEPIVEAAEPDLLEESLLPESGDYSAPIPVEPAIEEVRIGQPDAIDVIPTEVEVPEIAAIGEEGVRPMTPAPEDTSYLEEPENLEAGDEALMSEALASEPIVEEALVEPDLSAFDLGGDELEVSEELPLAGGELPSEDLVLDIGAGPDYGKARPSEEIVPEAEFLEPVQEIEETSFGEINLHEEKVEAAKSPALSASSAEPSEVEEIDIFSDADMVGNLGAEEEATEEIDLSEESLEETGAPLAGAIEPSDEDIVIAAEEEGAAPEDEPKATSPKASPRQVEAQPADEDDKLKSEIKSVLSYLDKLLDSLPEEKIEEFAHSEYFDTYKKLFEELGLV